MTVLSMVTTIQSIVADSSGIRSAPTEMPTSLNDSGLPCALTFPGAGTWAPHVVGAKRHDREYVIRVYVKPVSQGRGIDEGYQNVLPIMDALGRTFLNDLSLGGTIDHLSEIRCSGIMGDLQFAGTPYHGFELRLIAAEKGT